jgi:long-chain acyl-CoA synthetase
MFDGLQSGKSRSCDRAALMLDARIADPDDKEAPRGTVGVMQICRPNVMLGYWNKPKETAAGAPIRSA